MKKTFATLCLLFFPMLLNAQGIIKKVNDIKLSEDYIWAQYANPSPDSAFVKAKEWLALLVSEAEGKSVSIQKLTPYIHHIYLKGETVTRAFVYIKKHDIQTALNKKTGESEVQTFYKPDSLTEAILSLKDIYAARDFFEVCISRGEIDSYGAPKNTDDISSKHLVLFDKENLAPTFVFSPTTEGKQRINLKDGTVDPMTSHHGCYAIWYDIKLNSKKE